MYVDFKTTVWERVSIPEHLEEKILNAIKNGEIQTPNEMFGIDEVLDDFYEVLLETSEQLTPEENNGFATIEIHDSDNKTMDKIIYANGKY